jgi:hypothetical protein
MEVLSLSPLPAGSLLWQPRAGSYALTVVAKATFVLLPGESVLAESQEPLCADEIVAGDGVAAGVSRPCDLVPRKARADVTLVGHAYAPRGEGLRSLVARLVIGQLDKEIELWGERCFTREGQLREGARFSRMPLRHERAAGGPGTENPLGVRTGPGALPDHLGQIFLPNLQVPGATPEGRGEAMTAICFAPIPRSFPARREKLGPLSPRFEEELASVPLPDDFDVGYFNAAPQDQQLALLRDSERIILQNLHRDHPRLLTSLPGLHPRAFLQRPGVPPKELGLKCDTLWIDSDRGLCTLTFRGQIALRAPDEAGRVLFALERPGERVTFEEVERLAGPYVEPAPIAAPGAELRTMALPGALPPEPEPSTAPGFHQRTAKVPIPRFEPALPFQPADPGAPPPLVAAPSPAAASPPRRQMVQTSAVPFELPPKHGVPAWLAATPGAPAPIAPPPLMAPPAPAVEPSRNWEPAPAVEPARSWEPAPRPPLRSDEYLPPAPAEIAQGGFSLMAASNAAAEAMHGREARASAPELVVAPVRARREALDLLWVDPAASRAIRAAFGELLAPLKAPAKVADKDEAKRLELERIEAEAVRVLMQAPRADAAALEALLARAVGDDGRLRAPLVVLTGELRFPFDALDSLKALVGAASPLAAAGTPLGEALDRAGALLASPFVGSAPGAAELLGQQVREAFVQHNRSLPQRWLDEQVEQTMLEQRRHQRRTVLGEPRIRALLAPPGGGAPLPCYLPEALGKTLPMYAAMEVRVLAEAHPPQDPREASPISLQPKALARVLTLGG